MRINNLTNMGKIKGGIIIGFLAVALVVGVFAGYNGFKQLFQKDTLGLADAYFLDNASDVFGTKTATTTVGQCFTCTLTGGLSATSTAVKKIDGSTDVAIYTIKSINASTTARLQWEIEGSQDYQCDTTATSGGNKPLVGEINWFPVGDHERGASQTTSHTNASSTKFHVWDSLTANYSQTVILENLNYECLRLNMAGSSTEAWVQLATK